MQVLPWDIKRLGLSAHVRNAGWRHHRCIARQSAFAALLSLTLFAPFCEAATLTTLFSFNYSSGASPLASLVQGSDGNFYGTTYSGGALDSNGDGCDPQSDVYCGTVFKITTSGTLTTLDSFGDPSDSGMNGAYPRASLVQGSDGNFYGTTWVAGTGGGGTVIKVTPAGALTPLYSFTGGTDGANPTAALVLGSDGNFYGTEQNSGPTGHGSIFKITPTGTLTTTYGFNGAADGGFPTTALTLGSDGNFYGTTAALGTTGGTIFKVTASGTLTTLYSFTGGTDGTGPSSLTEGSDGNFYGTTFGNSSTNFGTVFSVTPSGILTTLYSFAAGADGARPSSLVLGSDGSFYGTTQGGFSTNYGTIFKVTSSGTLTTLYSFTGGADGGYPAAPPVQGSDGNFYGTTSVGGGGGVGCISGCGTVYKLSVLSGLSISSPPTQSNYQLTLSNYSATPDIPFVAVSSDTSTLISWKLILNYSATDGKGTINSSKSFTTKSGATKDEVYTNTGGQLTATATQGAFTAQVILTITGEPIPDATITAQLDSLYSSGATPNLLTGIAEQESSYRQFDGTETKYNYTGYWPNESKQDGGSHIGLMMVPTTAAVAWNWLTNTSSGASVFQSKLAAAARNATKIINANPGLPNLTPVQLENMALLLYGPYAPVSNQLNNQYYIPSTSGGSPVWVVNTANNPNGVAYANFADP